MTQVLLFLRYLQLGLPQHLFGDALYFEQVPVPHLGFALDCFLDCFGLENCFLDCFLLLRLELRIDATMA